MSRVTHHVFYLLGYLAGLVLRIRQIPQRRRATRYARSMGKAASMRYDRIIVNHLKEKNP